MSKCENCGKGRLESMVKGCYTEIQAFKLLLSNGFSIRDILAEEGKLTANMSIGEAKRTAAAILEKWIKEGNE